ncbi:MAG TPA: EscJ/YscJ/HrcJ family type III secretion inner membrane ring protein [Leucothrix mucor]|nr:EscJ/YscJ/HrcJ family type III secretion inner membrane ring protein [Leucothrix mucor]
MKNNNVTTFVRLKLVLLSLFLGVFLSSCQMELFSNLSESDVNNMLSIMLSNGIDSEKIIDKKTKSYILMIDKSKIPEAISLLREHGYPREKVAGIQDLFKKEGLVSSPMEERVRYIYALSQSVQETLSQIDGVLTARVHIVMPENNPFVNTNKPSSASVFIKYHPSSDVRNIKSKIKLIVEKSIEGLTYEKVSVVMLPAQLSYAK